MFFGAAPPSAVAAPLTPPATAAPLTWSPDRAFGTSGPALDESESGLSTALALVVGILILVFDVGYRHLTIDLTSSTRHATEYLVRESTSLDLVFYLLVGGALVVLITTKRVHLVFCRGRRIPTIAIGLACGLGAGLSLLAVNRVLSGGIASDPRIVQPVSEGGFLRIALTVVLACVLAPLIEETLFRGVLAGSFPNRAEQLGILVSAVAFAVWHWMLNVTTLTYYTMLGIGLALVWRKLGLLGSMAAHAAFNGIVILTAVALVNGPGQTHQLGDISYHVPGGWHTEMLQTVGRSMHEVDEGPTTAEISFDERPNTAGITAQQELQVITRVASQVDGLSSAQRLIVTNAQLVQTQGGQLAVADVVSGGQSGHLATFVTSTDELWTVLEFGDGSNRSESDWTKILDSLRWPTLGTTTA